jgi:two-component system sensor histidine kinase YesM
MDSIKDSLDSSAILATTFSDELMILEANRNLLLNYSSMTETEKKIDIVNIDVKLKKQIWFLKNAVDVKLFTSDYVDVYSMNNIYVPQTSYDNDLMKIENCETYECWFVSYTYGKPAVVNARKIMHPGTLEVFGYQLIYIDPSFLGKISIEPIFDNKGELFISDGFNNTFRYNGQTFDTNRIDVNDRSIINKILDLDKNYEVKIFKENKDNFVCYSTNKRLNWTIISKIPNDSLYKSAYSIFPVFVICCIILLFLSYIISKIIIKSIQDPLDKLIFYIEQASEKKFNIPIVDEANDELSYLVHSYNKIVLNMGNLVKQIETEQDEKRDAEIRMLQAQINPHFLFNSLDSLKFAAIMSNAFSVSEGLSSLSKLLRSSIIQKNSSITIKEEIENIKNYLIIQKIRQGDVINFECDIQERCLDLKIMKLLLQPIVENSIIHGLDDSKMLSIKLICKSINGEVFIKIKDNGVGFKKNQLFDEKLNGRNSFSGVGLNNVKERLSLEFKEKQFFKIFSKEGKGTVVIIKYPEEIKNV